VVSAREIAVRYSVPLALLTNILKGLNRAGIVCSERGVYGGYRLGRPAENINLHELITAIEGPFQFVQCATPAAETPGAYHPEHLCGLESCCPIRFPAHRIRDRLARLLEGVTLAELVGEDQDGEAIGTKSAVRRPELISLRTTRKAGAALKSNGNRVERDRTGVRP
jgi:Rrf2 family protein